MISVHRRSRARMIGVTLAAALLIAGCGSDDDTAPTTTAAGGAAIDAKRCADNRAAGKITYLTSFDFSASAAIVDVIVAKKLGYFEQLCLDVELRPGFATQNYDLVAGGRAQFSSAGNYTEILNFSGEGRRFRALLNYGKSPVEGLVTREGGATDLSQLKGKRIGKKGDIPPSIVALLARAGLQRGRDYEEVTLDGYDPAVHLQQSIDALPVYKTNEPGQLDKKGIKYTLFDPTASNVPGSFGLLYTSAEYAEDHPEVVRDFTRAALKGMEAALADKAAAIAACMELINASGNQFFLSEQTETFRWTQESKLVVSSTPPGEPVGLIDPPLLATEYDTYVKAGVWPKGPPADGKYYDAELARSLYGADGKVDWPG